MSLRKWVAEKWVIDSYNNIYVTGQYQSSSQVILQDANGTGQTASLVTLPATSLFAAFIAKYSISGQVQWATYIDGTGSDLGFSVTTDSYNNIYATGQYNSSSQVTLRDVSGTGQTASLVTLPSTSSNAVFIAKYNTSGQVQSATYIDGTGSDIGRSIISDSNNNLYVTGQYQSSSQVTLQDVSGNSQTPSLITLPAVSADGLMLVKYI